MKRAFQVKSKGFFIISKELSVARNCLRPESVPLNVVSGFLGASRYTA